MPAMPSPRAAAYTAPPSAQTLTAHESRQPESPSQRALTACTIALALALGCLALLLPPLLSQTLSSVLRTVATALTLATALLLHWTFLGVAARRMHRSAPGWVSLSVLLFPIGSAAAVILLGWFDDEGDRHRSGSAAPTPAPHHG